MELVHERDISITDDTGKLYDCVRVYAQPQSGGTWAGILESDSAEDARANLTVAVAETTAEEDVFSPSVI